jgi:methionine sulfoxide reductase heme-binding subunit
MPWNDRAGKFSPLKALVFTGLFIPAIMISGSWATGQLGPRPVTEAIHETGDWAIRFLFISLAVTPLRRIADWPKLIIVRRMIGLAALSYALAHFCLYMTDQNFNLVRVASEIALRIYLTIGFATLIGLSVLGATSTDAAIRKLGRNWNRLHKVVYALGILAALHFFMQTKADVYEATLMSGLFVLLMIYRLAHWRDFRLSSPAVLVGAAILAALVTVGLEYAWYGLATGIPPSRVLAANLQFAFSVRPAWWVLAIGAAVAAIPPLRALFRGTDSRSGRRVARARAA